MIQIESVHKYFGSNHVLKDVSANIGAGQVVCLIGPSGSGKSTVLRCINGLETYERGLISIKGQKVDASDTSIRSVRQKVGMVFQRFNLFPHRTALENVTEGPIHVKKESQAEASEYGKYLLNKVGLGHRIDFYPSQLSGGQQQRVAIARSLAMRPDAILFDEPTSALDPELVGEVLGVMRSLAEEGMTMVIVTHEMDFARNVADEVIFLEQGSIIEQGKASEVLKNPSSERLQSFLSRIHS